MSTLEHVTPNHTLAALFGSEARAAVLHCLFARPEGEVFLRDIARQCGMAVTPVHRQLRKLEQIGLVESRILGKARAYRLRPGFPGLGPLAALVQSEDQLVPMLRQALAGLDIAVAFVFGSVAAGTSGPQSDIDLFVIGEAPDLVVSRRLWDLQGQLHREINEVTMTPAAFRERMQSPSAFLMNVMRLEKIFLMGDENALRGLAEQPCDPAAPIQPD